MEAAKQNSEMDQVNTIIQNPDYRPPLNLAMAISWVVLHYKGNNLKIFDMRGISPLADYFVLADVENPIQAEALSNQIVWLMKHARSLGLSDEAFDSEFRVRGVEGGRDSNWTLIDLNQVIVHIFIEKSRELYKLESLWPHAPRVEIPESFYFQNSNQINLNFSTAEITEIDEDQYL
ncbi:MAG: ribosome silencing factor [Oligoflexia bacterium]|nr:ribosome silencing factor [Oligoflexia bacterium]